MPPRVSVPREALRPLVGVYVNERTKAGLIVSFRGDSALVTGQGVGPELVPVGPGRFRLAGSASEFEFRPDGTAIERFVAGWPARSPATWRRHAPWSPTAAELAAYAGTYTSAELGATYTVSVRDSTLVLRTRWAQEVTVRPVYRDAFVGNYTVEFTRTGGKIDGMRWTTGRARGVRFVRASK
jgi:hypothetical protein